MCYSLEASIAAFAIGTSLSLANIYIFRTNLTYVAVSLMWLLGSITMQLWEAFLWAGYDCKLFSFIAMVNNVFQPFLCLIVLLAPGYIATNKVDLMKLTLVY